MQLWSNDRNKMCSALTKFGKSESRKFIAAEVSDQVGGVKTSSQESINSSVSASDCSSTERFVFLKKRLSMSPYTDESFEARMLSIYLQ